ncbi:cupin domain-containing protein [Photobacterium damselae subsp. damselae]|uniref:cupin domain-containing protein n=1 Tax=Photobacterium damselae TaxID=38293 RepID=UPI000A2FB836|nr:cupin domain-containing protein [Photobacterium damselae]ARR51071.1 cupin [Photobacterium damselae subsp. damselae]QAY37143.1 cupin domain-containing protein [Photobacterium damselae subsp. damselae]
MKNAINLKDKLKIFSDFWSPRVISELNDYQVKLAKFKGEFAWHDHKDTDELFLVISGSMKIQFKDGFVDLKEGEMYIVPKMALHRPIADNECHVMIIEPRGVINTGDADSKLKADNDIWI